MSNALDIDLDRFLEQLARLGQRRAWFVRDPATLELRASARELSPIAEQITRSQDFREHEAIFFERAPKTGALLSAFLHKTVRGQGAGGVRHWPYSTLGELVRDGLRLSQGMTRKNALAGLWWGGGKGIIARQSGESYLDPAYRGVLYREYGAFIASLRGCYVTAEDVGTTASDMAEIFHTTRHVTCVPPEVGGSGNPSPSTARGVVCAIEAALDYLALGTLEGKRIAMQGTGNVGTPMIGYLLEKGVANLVATDIDPKRVEALKRQFAGGPFDVKAVATSDRSIFSEPCDVFVPNALGGALNPETIPLLQARVVCGAANNQLLDEERDAELLLERGITYVPDFVANRMGIVNCANEQYGTLTADPAIERHFGRTWENSVFVITRRVLARADAEGTSPTQAANAVADELAQKPHPIFGHRAQDIIRSLVEDNWHLG